MIFPGMMCNSQIDITVVSTSNGYTYNTTEILVRGMYEKWC